MLILNGALNLNFKVGELGQILFLGVVIKYTIISFYVNLFSIPRE